MTTTAPYVFSSGCLKGPLCSLCSETKEEDRPGRERGSKGGSGGGALGHLPVMHFRSAMSLTCRLLTHRILQAPSLSLSLHQHRHCRKANCPTPPSARLTPHRRTNTHAGLQKWICIASLLCFSGECFLISSGNRHAEFSYELKSMLAVISHSVSVSWYCVVHPGCLSHCQFLLERWDTQRSAVFYVAHVTFPTAARQNVCLSGVF